MHRRGQALQLCTHALVHPHLVGEGQAVRRHPAVGHGGQADTTRRHLGVMANQPIAGHTVRAHALEGGGLYHPVAQVQAGQLGGGEQFFQGQVHADGSTTGESTTGLCWYGTNSTTSSSKPDTAL